MIISITDLREHVETDLSDRALDTIISDADAAVVARFGAHGGETVTQLRISGGSPLLFLAQPAASVESVTEYTGVLFGTEVETELEEGDWRLSHGDSALQRLHSGPNAAVTWGHEVDVEYVAARDSARRRRVIVDLCKLAIAFNALKTEGAGDYRATGLDDYQAERERILSELAPAGGIVLA